MTADARRPERLRIVVARLAGAERVHGTRAVSSHSELFLRLIARQVPVELMSDHAPINYTSGV